MKFANNLPPPHLVDLGVVENLQHYGRERRHEYWTIPSLRSLFANEGLEADSAEKFEKIMNTDMSRAGGFAVFDASDFYDGTDSVLGQFVDSFNRSTFGSSTSKRTRVPKNPVRSDGTVVTGRPRKEWSLKRTTEEAGIQDADAEAMQPPKKRGRVKITQPPSTSEEPPKKRGRQSKKSKEAQAQMQPEVNEGAVASTSRTNEKSPASRSKAPSRKSASLRTSNQVGSDTETHLSAAQRVRSKALVPPSDSGSPSKGVAASSVQPLISTGSDERMADPSAEQAPGVKEATVSRLFEYLISVLITLFP